MLTNQSICQPKLVHSEYEARRMLVDMVVCYLQRMTIYYQVNGYSYNFTRD